LWGGAMKKKVILSIIVLAIISTIGFKIYSDASSIIKQPFIVEGDTIEVTVKTGDSLNGVINSLYEDKKLGNAYLIKWYIKKYKLNTNIKPGTYTFSKDITIENFIKGLGEGKYNENAIRVTIPEGYDIEGIASLLQDKGIIEKEKFLQSVKEYALPGYIKADAKRKYQLEGYLFPDTYEFVKGMKGNDVINIMVKNFEKVQKEIEQKIGRTLDTNELDKLLIMASIVEREAELASERPIVASVFFNRIKINMKLQSCATVEYALGVHKTVYTLKDLEVQSPFNTYLVSGLPVGPICNPGKSSILAAAEPAKTDYLFFVSKFDGTKTHFFSKDYAEFERNKKISEKNMAKMN
jgi:UPF0755 protein